RASSPPRAGARSGTPSYTTRREAAGRPLFSRTCPTAALTAITRRQRRYFQRESGAGHEVASEPHLVHVEVGGAGAVAQGGSRAAGHDHLVPAALHALGGEE